MQLPLCSSCASWGCYPHLLLVLLRDVAMLLAAVCGVEV
jgi:hypothetical protein